MTDGAGRPRRRHAAAGSRILATGVAACATFGIVVGMALGRTPANPTTPEGVTSGLTAVERQIDLAPPADSPVPAPPATTSGGS
jgi:hypothetical protein